MAPQINVTEGGNSKTHIWVTIIWSYSYTQKAQPLRWWVIVIGLV